MLINMRYTIEVDIKEFKDKIHNATLETQGISNAIVDSGKMKVLEKVRS